MKKSVVSFFAGTLSATLFVLPVLAAGDYGLSATAGQAELTQYGTNLPAIIGTAIGAGLSLIGVVFFVLVVYGGLTWMTARGEAAKVQKAMDTVIAAAIGLVLVLAAYAITNFVMNSVDSGGGGNDGSPVVEDDSGCLAKGDGWSCKSIDSCGLTFADGADIRAKRDVCSAASESCALNLCDGMANDIVCCN